MTLTPVEIANHCNKFANGQFCKLVRNCRDNIGNFVSTYVQFPINWKAHKTTQTHWAAFRLKMRHLSNINVQMIYLPNEFIISVGGMRVHARWKRLQGHDKALANLTLGVN